MGFFLKDPLLSLSSSVYSRRKPPVHPSARVAPELQDRILDYLHDSKKDLSIHMQHRLQILVADLSISPRDIQPWVCPFSRLDRCINSIAPYINRLLRKASLARRTRCIFQPRQSGTWREWSTGQASYSNVQLGECWSLKFRFLFFLKAWNHFFSSLDEPGSPIDQFPIVHGPCGFS